MRTDLGDEVTSGAGGRQVTTRMLMLTSKTFHCFLVTKTGKLNAEISVIAENYKRLQHNHYNSFHLQIFTRKRNKPFFKTKLM